MAEKHLGLDELSSRVDGEALGPAARAHLASCSICVSLVLELASVDPLVASPLAVSCDAMAELLSAELDGEAQGAEMELVRTHVAACATCAATRAAWHRVDDTLAGLPALRAPVEKTPAIARPGLPNLVLGVGARAVVAILLAITLTWQPPVYVPSDVAQGTVPRALVAAVDQMVVNTVTGRIYVLQPASAAVSVYDAGSRELLTSIVIGGNPVAIDVNTASNLVYVLDAESKTVKTIDGARDSVVASVKLDVAGVPTTLQVDGSQDRFVVGTAATAQSKGEVAIVTAGTGASMRTSGVEASPERVVLEASRDRLFVTGASSTSVLDASTLRVLDTIPGAVVDIATSSTGSVALLREDQGATVVEFYQGARSLRLDGRARAITALPDGRFAALVGTSDGASIFVFRADGRVESRADAPAGAKQLAYDADRATFAIAADDGIHRSSTGAVAQGPQVTTPTGTTETPAPATNARTLSQASTAGRPTVRAAPPEGATQPGRGRYRLAVANGRAPVHLVSASDEILYVDIAGGLDSLDPRTGQLTNLANIPGAVSIRLSAVTSSRLYLYDAGRSRLLIYWPADHRFSEVQVPFPVTAMTATESGGVWFAGGSDALMRYDSFTGKFDLIRLPGVRDVTVVAAEASGRIWFGGASSAGYYEPGVRHIARLDWGQGVTALAVDADGVVWATTTQGYVVGMRRDDVVASRKVGTRADAVLLDQHGAAWFASRTEASFALGRASSGATTEDLQPDAAQAIVDDHGRAWYFVPGYSAFFVADLFDGAR